MYCSSCKIVSCLTMSDFLYKCFLEARDKAKNQCPQWRDWDGDGAALRLIVVTFFISSHIATLFWYSNVPASSVLASVKIKI